ncbi:acyl-CoA dehydratase activase [Anaerotignum propionicum]|uniref:Activator of (R)-2-hydroxyglutaryl-CoA dehydratase n=1 Tax=Anaerotignum propionicum DSM 1682 TaxID=991789 RepID=A0A0X1U8W2_ANAPI|nr:acyl-CoA dehydratase activase [Anaerotignum propionicum]AMJ41372.1 activator of (R)-2-hydroxyglutaryl-CoA dehydratase [Anaerotignum propionicum DSM 1682]SHE98058.1 CoA-substrate-specific enzyme activase, putative [[Clostridium] propionicum DSM 1682] [Anaerotignum propionicum DSM 1682]
MNYFMGLDMGSASIKAVILNEKKEILYKNKFLHFGKPCEAAKKIISEIALEYKNKRVQILLTGANAKLIVDETWIARDIPSIEKGLSALCPSAKSAIEIGSQNARFLTRLGEDTPPMFSVNENCAGGTGSFFEDQMYRLGLKTEDYSKIAAKAVAVPRLSGRCSVFAKTDIIHRQQEGVSTPDILLGLCYATIRNLKSTIIKNLPVEKPVALCGGIIHNSGVIKAVKEIFELTEEELIVLEECEYIQAIGAASMAKEKIGSFTLQDCDERIDHYLQTQVSDSNILRLPSLVLSKDTVIQEPVCVPVKESVCCSMGIDVGSTSTNIVLINQDGEIVDFQYLRTKGDPQGAVKEGFQSIKERFGNILIIKSVGVTGSGRYLVGKMIGADFIKDEITAQGKAAVCVCPEVDTVFEIGGQDSKYIQLENGYIKDFQMNKICAAGTGSFIEEQANRLEVRLDDYGEIALSAKHPVDLGERCTVFIDSNIAACLSNGIGKADILAGLCHSVIHNYLFKVVGNKPVGNHIVLQGGVCYNPAIVAAFQGAYGAKVMVSPYFSVSGAYGVAVLAAEEIGEKQTIFKGFDLSHFAENEDFSENINIKLNTNFYDKAKEYLLEGYKRELFSNKITIGIPYVLVVHKLFPMVRAFFEALGYNVLLSPETDEQIIALSQKYAQAETCYPVKLIYGHMAWLAERKVDYIFLPSIITMKHECSKVYHNYGCMYMQSAPKLIFENMELGKQGIVLLNPMFSLDFGKKAMADAMVDVGVSLGKVKPICAAALMRGAMAVRKHTEQVEKLGEELLDSLNPDEKVLVIVTRTYGIDDPVLNMGIPEELLKRGYKVITLSHLPAHSMDISKEYGNLYWPFGQHILSGAKLIANHPNLYGVYLTNHGCGPDTMLSHLFHKEMGEKPYLNIEVDEHFSKVGVITRIEAFLNSLNAQPKVYVNHRKEFFSDLPQKKVEILHKAQKDQKLYLPYLYPYSQIISNRLNKNGYSTEVLPQTNAQSLALGRSKTRSKEYLSFTALVGDVLTAVQQMKELIQIFIPQTEGSESDGIYTRVIYDFLPKNDKIKLVTATLETLPFESEFFEEFFMAILAGDAILSAPISQRKELMEQVLSYDKLTIEHLAALAKNILLCKQKKISVIGEPYILYNSFLNEKLLEVMEEEGERIQWMPLSEYLCYLWKKRAETKSQKEIVKSCEEQMSMVSKLLCENSSFSESLDMLFCEAEKKFPKLTGANASYRFSKHACTKNCQAVVDISSLYENAQTIINLMQGKCEVPILSLSFEGSNDIRAKERLQSFLYYMNKQ